MKPVLRKPADAPPRVQPLATLPIFVQLADRRAVVAGGTAAAAWKAELLAAAGAVIDLYAPEPTAEQVSLAHNQELPGEVRLVLRSWTGHDLEGAALAILDAASDEEATAFRAAATRAGVPCNVIDRPDACDFTFGSIVNRSPVVVGISTDGAAPVLGQAIRQRIETLLPQAIGPWAALARQLRQRIKALAPDSRTRRSLWARFSDSAFTRPPEDAETEFHRLRSAAGPDAAANRNGSVTLVGAGPGDPGLLTLAAVRAMQAADVILFDDLVSQEVLDLGRREAKRMMVGKRGRRASCRQDDINALMVRLARQGKRVVRLKSGDPMIFGRAGEEIDMLDVAGIEVDVVPGITAAAALAARTGISLTHRDHARSVRYVTGHSRHGELPEDLDWDGLADPRTSLVFYMAGRTGQEAARRLIDRGLAASTPAVIAAGLSSPAEKFWLGTLADLAAGEAMHTSAPVLIGIGQVFAGRRAETGTVDALSVQPRQSFA